MGERMFLAGVIKFSFFSFLRTKCLCSGCFVAQQNVLLFLEGSRCF